MKPPTSIRIAELAGVSQATVSDVLNDRWRQKRISVKTRDRILRIAQRHNYRPNRLARSLRSGRSNILSLLLPGISGVYFPRLVFGVESEAKHHGMHVLLSHVLRGLEEEIAEIEMLLERRVDGMIITPRHGVANREKYRQLLKKFPFVFVNDCFKDVPCSAVVGDDEEGAFLATSHLVKLGHRRIAYLPLNPGPNVARVRLNGYRRALATHGLALRKEYMPDFVRPAEAGYGKMGALPGYAEMRALLGLRAPPTAIFAFNDHVALGGIRAAQEAGLRVPQDVAVVGYGDDLAPDWFLKVGVTTVRVDSEAMGRRAVQILLEEMQKPRLPKRLEKIPARLIVRESCGGRVA